MFCHTWVTGLQTRLVPLDLYNSFNNILFRQLHHFTFVIATVALVAAFPVIVVASPPHIGGARRQHKAAPLVRMPSWQEQRQQRRWGWRWGGGDGSGSAAAHIC